MDLQTLSRRKPTQAGAGAVAAVPVPKRRWLTRTLVPAGIVLAVILLLAYAGREWLLPATEVNVVRATAVADVPSSHGANPGAPVKGGVVAQAPGWVEPDPYPIYVSALADGVVETVEVLEGETIDAGQVLVRLVKEDAQLALDGAKAELAMREATLTAAKTDMNEPVALRRAASVSAARYMEAQALLARLDAEIAEQQAKLDEASAAYERLADLSERSVSRQQLESAEYSMKSQQALLKATSQRKPALIAAADAAKAEAAAAKRDLELKTDLKRAVDETTAAVQAAKANLAEAELRFSRMTITSPRDGVVMRRLVGPGAKVMLGMDGEYSAHVIHLYDPASLQVRVDVPLADAASVGVGQQAEIIVDVLPDATFSGVVTRVVHQADLAKNTLQFKVEIEGPSPLLKPDMLARVKFFGVQSGVNSPITGALPPAGAVVAIAKSAVVNNAQAEPFVWWVSPTDNRLKRRPVKLGPSRADGTVVIRRGLNPGDAVVDQPSADLSEGQRVRFR